MSLRTALVRGSILAAVAMLPVAALAQSRQLTRGATSVELSTGFIDAFNSLGVSAKPIAPANLVGKIIWFPITAGEIDPANAHVEIFHSGGLQLEANGTKVRLLNFVIDTTGASPVLTGAVVVNAVFWDGFRFSIYSFRR